MTEDQSAEEVSPTDEEPTIEDLEPLTRALTLSWGIWFGVSAAIAVATTVVWAIISGEENLAHAGMNGPIWVNWPVTSTLVAFMVGLGVLLLVLVVSLLADLYPIVRDDLKELASASCNLLRMTVDAWKEVYREYVR